MDASHSFRFFGTVSRASAARVRKMKVLVARPCGILWNSTDCNPPDTSVHGILQARILEWVAIPFCRGSSWPRDRTRPPVLQADSLPSELPGKQLCDSSGTTRNPSFQNFKQFVEICGFPGGSVVKNPPANAGLAKDTDLIPRLGRSAGWGNGNALQYSYLENPMVREAWRATVHGIARSQMRLNTHARGNLNFALCLGFCI